MPLAGKMKLNHFLALMGTGGLLAVGAGGYALYSLPVPVPVADAPAPAPRPVPRRAADKLVLAKLRLLGGRPIDGNKAKDMLGANNPKVNLYQDEGHDGVNRLKVDWDRDDRWDEKWTFEDGGVSRQISVADDEDYATTLHWNGQSWSEAGAAAAAPTAAVPDAPSPPPPGADDGGVVGPGTAIQAFLMGRASTDLGTSKVKDASKGTSWKVNLYQDEGFGVMNRAKVDLDRDDKWDEKWTFAEDGISKQVSPADDENYTETWVFDGARWSRESG